MKMKRIILSAMLVFLLVGTIGCNTEDSINIEGHDWHLTFVLSSEDGKVVGCAPEHYEAHKDDVNIQEMDLDCIVSDGTYTIIDATSSTEYSGTYEIMEENKESIIYTLTSREKTGMAVTSITKGDDGSKTPTLIITMDGYDLNFQSEEIE